MLRITSWITRWVVKQQEKWAESQRMLEWEQTLKDEQLHHHRHQLRVTYVRINQVFHHDAILIFFGIFNPCSKDELYICMCTSHF
jgi:hypothetical protein